MAQYDVSLATRDVVGTGIRIPFSFSSGKGIRAVTVADGYEKIISSIRMILMTRPGERVMQPEFGSRLYDLVFEQSDAITKDLLYLYTVEALERWERRIRVIRVSFIDVYQDQPEYIGIQIDFIILRTNQTGSYVFPFARNTMPMSSAVTGSESKRIFTYGQVLPLEGTSNNSRI